MIWRSCSRFLRHHFISCALAQWGSLLLQSPHEPTAVSESLRPCFTLPIAEPPYKLGSRAVGVGPADQIGTDFEDLS
jgi:hypothetical protein